MGAAQALWDAVRLLRPSQVRHLASVIWLTDPVGNRRSGRTLLITLAAMRHAVVSPGEKISLRDHHPGPLHEPHGGQQILQAVSGILNGMGPRSNLVLSSSGPWIQYDGKNGLEGPNGVSKSVLLEDFRAQATSAMAAGASMEELVDAVLEAEVRKTMEA